METIEATKEEKTINLSLAILDKRESELIEMKSKYEGLTIDGIEDTEGYDKVDEARKELKSARVQIEKDAKELRDPLVKLQKAIISREGKLIDIIEPLEKSLHGKTKTIDEERDRIKAEEDRKKAEKINNRISALNALNYGVDIQIISSVTDEKFEEILAEAKVEFDKAEKIRIEEEQKQKELRKQEEERQAELRKQEEARLDEERKEIERLRAEHEEQERKLNEEREVIRKEQEAKEKELRDRQLKIETQERERAERIRAEEEAKAIKERAKQEEIARKKKEKEEAEQKMLFGQDSDRFSQLNGSFDVLFEVLEKTRDHMQSEQGKKAFAEIELLVYQAGSLCKQNSKEMEKCR